MPNVRKDFLIGKMDKDTDNRLVKGYRHAENVIILQSENSDAGTVQNSFSNKKLTSIDYGGGVVDTIGLYCDEFSDKIYWFTKSDSGCFLMEYDAIKQITSPVLKDTRAIESRVLNVTKDFLITGIQKIINEDSKEDLLLWTDDNMQPCCINIERAKSWTANGFVLEDILLIKKPPRYAPKLTPMNIANSANNIEEKFLTFCYRYKYRDGEYSALSSYTNYFFVPKDFKLDYYTMDNVGMVNAFNAVRIEFNTGESQVTDIQLCVKESNSNAIYIIETFNKANEEWEHDKLKTHSFSNTKLYAVLPTKELYRPFDNVPLKAKALTMIGNRPVFGNFLEGRDLVDANGNKVYVDYELSLINEPIEKGEPFTTTDTDNTFTVANHGNLTLKKGNKLIIYFSVNINSTFPSYENTFNYPLPYDYANLASLFNDDLFAGFIPVMSNDFKEYFKWDVPNGWSKTIDPTITYSLVAGVPTFTFTPVTYIDTLNANAVQVVPFSVILSDVSITETINATSLKTNRDYEVGIVYEDDFNRKTTVLTSLYNTLFVPQEYSVYKNRIKVKLTNPPPAWADRYKVVVKAQPLDYQTLYVNRFYSEDGYAWCKLEAENKDKVKVGDTLIVKKSIEKIEDRPIKIKVLALETKEKDFITNNNDDSGNPILEEAGVYMKIRPNGFSMDFKDFDINSSESKHNAKNQYAYTYINLFSTKANVPLPNSRDPQLNLDPRPTITSELALPLGSSIFIKFRSRRKYSDGWHENTYEYTHYAQRDYNTIEDWFTENILNRTLYPNVEDEKEDNRDYKDNLILKRGWMVNFTIERKWVYTDDKAPSYYSKFIEDPNGALYLEVKSVYKGGNEGENSYIEAEIVVRTSAGGSDGLYVFETEKKQAEQNIFYETEQTFDIIGGNHQGNLQNQNVSTKTPAIIDLDFFNCYTQGNGVESYRVKDGFNKNYLNIDLRPSTTSIEEYKANRRYADLTYGETYDESINKNGLNEFNLSTKNWKQLDKQFGSIQKLHSKDTNLIVLQEEKASNVLFGKREMKNADGTSNVVTSDVILGEQQTYQGENGIGKNPESFAVNDFQLFYSNIRRGLIQRLSLDGITNLIDGMVDYFRDLSITNKHAKILGGYDPYLNQYVLTVGNEPTQIHTFECGNTIIKENQSNPFSYILNLNELEGDTVLNYNITLGNATISALFNGVVSVVSNVTGIGSLTVPRTTLNVDTVQITITPVTALISYQISNVCPLGIPMKVVSVVLNDAPLVGKTITNRYRWGSSPFYAENDLFKTPPITRFLTESGIEGIGRMPKRGSTVTVQSFKDISSTASFVSAEGHRIGYLVSSTVYTEANIETLKGLLTYVTTTETVDSLTNKINAGSFVFNRTAENQILYLVWDYVKKVPQLMNDTAIVNNGLSVNINVLANDTIIGTPTVTIITQPINGTAVVNVDNTITYTHNGTATTADTLVYQVNNGFAVATASVSIEILAGAVVPGATSSFYYEGFWVEGDEIHPNGGRVTYIDANGLTQVQTGFYVGTCSLVTAQSIVSTQGVSTCVPNALPLAGNDIISVNEDTVLSASVAGNDTPSSDGGNTYSIATTTANGTLVFNTDGSYTYTPNTNFNGTDVFSYNITDVDGDVSTATVTITVNAVNDAPIAVGDTITTTENTSFTSSVDLDFNDTDLDGDSLTVVAGTFTTAQGGTLVLAADGSYTYTPALDFNGTDTVDYTVTDGFLTDIGTLTITVGAVPGATSSFYYEGFWVEGDTLHPNGGSVTYIDANGLTQVQTGFYVGTCSLVTAQSIVSTQGVSTCEPLYEYQIQGTSDETLVAYLIYDGSQNFVTLYLGNTTWVNAKRNSVYTEYGSATITEIGIAN